MKPNVSKIVGGSLLFLRNLFWTALLPGTVTLYLPYLIVTRWYPTSLAPWNMVQLLGLIPIVLGAAILLHCIWGFAVIGRATLSPLDAPRHLVVQGLYRYVRNPMYVGVMMILLGEALLFASVALVVYAVSWFVLVNLFIIFYEEPTLRRQFGAFYERYCRAVGRWWPGRPFNDADGAAEANM